MSARDEHVAAQYLRKKQRCPWPAYRDYYDPEPLRLRRSNPRVLAWVILLGMALCGLLLARCSATLRTITVEGQFTQAKCLWWWGEDYSGGTPTYQPLPFDYVLKCAYDDAATDEDSDSDFGQYLTSAALGGYVSLTFNNFLTGPMTILLGGSEVQVHKNRNGVKGISFGNLWWQPSNVSGLWYPQYVGLYCNFLVPTSYQVTVADDSLAQVETLKTSEVMRSNSYCLHQGFSDQWFPEFQVELQDNGIVYSVQ